MSKKVAIAKSAQLLGISRHVIQRLIRSGEIMSHDGFVDVDELRARFPGLTLDASPMLERVRFIKKTAFSRRVRERVEGGDDVDIRALTRRWKRSETERAVQAGRADRYQEILEGMLKWLAVRQCTADRSQQELIMALNAWLVQQLSDPEEQ